MDLSVAAISPDLLKPASTPALPNFTGLTDDQKRARIDKTSHAFEASFLSVMLGQMFDGAEAKAFGGGEGEKAFRSFLTDAMSKSMAAHGGIGLSKGIGAEMLKMQGLTAPSASAPGAATPANAYPTPSSVAPSLLKAAA